MRVTHWLIGQYSVEALHFSIEQYAVRRNRRVHLFSSNGRRSLDRNDVCTKILSL